MQDAMTIVIAATALLFAAATTIDFVAGLVKLWQDAGSKAQPRVKLQPTANQIDPASTLPDPWTLPVEETAIALPAEQSSFKQLLLPAARVQVATLQWLERNLPPAEIFIVEMPDAISLAKSRLPKAAPAPVVQLATRQELINSGIRKCKKLASQLGVRRYSVMKLNELADVLVGKITPNDLAA